MIGQSIAVLDEQFFRVFGQWAGEGGTTQLILARQTNMVPVGLIGQAASVAAFPLLARLVAEGKTEEMKETLSTALRYIIFVGVPATAAVLAASQPTIRVLYQRGEFSAAATTATASALVVLSFSITLWATHQVYARAFYAERKMWPPVLLGTGATVVYLLSIGPLFDRFGLPGIATASVIGVASYAASMVVTWHIRHGWSSLQPVLGTLLRSLGAGIPAAVAGWLAADRAAGPVAEMSFGQGVLALVAGGGVLLVVYFTSSMVLRSPEALEFLNRVRGRQT